MKDILATRYPLDGEELSLAPEDAVPWKGYVLPDKGAVERKAKATGEAGGQAQMVSFWECSLADAVAMCD